MQDEKLIYVAPTVAPPAYDPKRDEDHELLIAVETGLNSTQEIKDPKGCCCIPTKILSLFIITFELVGYFLAFTGSMSSYYDENSLPHYRYPLFTFIVMFSVNWLALSGIVNEKPALLGYYFIKKFVKITFSTVGVVGIIMYWDQSFAAIKGFMPQDLYKIYTEMMSEANAEPVMTVDEFWAWMSNLTLSFILVWYALFLFVQMWIIKTVRSHANYLVLKRAQSF